MAFSYTAGSTADRDRVRLEIGDTDESRVLFQDAELDDFISQEGNSILGAAARACETLAVKFARDFTFSADGATFQKGNVTQMFMAQAKRLRRQARATTTVMPRRVDGYSVYTDSDEVTGLNILDSGTGQYGRYSDEG
tara:strand:- start:1184 stop:1597 length:414 start_codon:yes stop_codon:yes gene_type:complete